eukprot:5020019-Amphidinium_carterae.1
MMPPANTRGIAAKSNVALQSTASLTSGHCELEVSLAQIIEVFMNESGLEATEILMAEHLPAMSATNGEWRIRLHVWRKLSLCDLRRYRTTSGPDSQLLYITVSTKMGAQLVKGRYGHR